jgi:hypothetical protein
VTKATYRTHPIQIFIDPPLSREEQLILKDYFNMILEYLRKEADSEFMTTYKYSGAEYTRKYLGLSQAKKIISTFPINSLDQDQRTQFKEIIDSKDIGRLLKFLKK